MIDGLEEGRELRQDGRVHAIEGDLRQVIDGHPLSRLTVPVQPFALGERYIEAQLDLHLHFSIAQSTHGGGVPRKMADFCIRLEPFPPSEVTLLNRRGLVFGNGEQHLHGGAGEEEIGKVQKTVLVDVAEIVDAPERGLLGMLWPFTKRLQRLNDCQCRVTHALGLPLVSTVKLVWFPEDGEFRSVRPVGHGDELVGEVVEGRAQVVEELTEDDRPAQRGLGVFPPPDEALPLIEVELDYETEGRVRIVLHERIHFQVQQVAVYACSVDLLANRTRNLAHEA